jgi:hypothetical protein
MKNVIHHPAGARHLAPAVNGSGNQASAGAGMWFPWAHVAAEVEQRFGRADILVHAASA